MSLLKRITESGVKYADSKLEQRNILMTNYLSMVLASLPLVLLIARWILYGFNAEVIAQLLVGIIAFILPVLLNRLGFIWISRYILCWTPPVFILIGTVLSIEKGSEAEVPIYIGLRFFLLAFSYYPFLVFSLKNLFQLLLGLLVPFLSILFFDPILDFFGAGYAEGQILSFPYAFNTIRALASFAIIGAGSYFLKRAVEKSEEVNNQLLQELEAKNKFIQQQAESEVNQLNEQLYSNLQQLSEREFILNQSQRIAKIGSWEYRIANNFLFWSDEMYALFGLDRNYDIQTTNLSEAIGKEGTEQLINANVNLLRANTPYDITIRTKTPIGYTKWFRIYAYPILEANNAIGIRGICHDITFFKEAEEKLRASEIKFSKVFANYPDFIMVVRESDLLVVDVNHRIEQVLGFTKEEVIGGSARAMDLFFSEEERQKYIQQYDSDGYIEFECQWKRKDKRIIDVKITGIRLDIDGQYYRMSVVRDITEAKQAEKEKERARYLLNERIKELTSLYRTSQILRQEQKSLHEMLLEIVKILPSGWQYPEIAVARIDLGGEVFTTSNFENAKHRQKAKFQIPPNATGLIEVAYTEDKPTESEGPFLTEERNLINMVAEMLEEHLARKYEQESLTNAQANLKATINNTEVLIWSVDRQFRLIMFNIPFYDYVKKNYSVEIEVGKIVLPPENDIQKWWEHNYLKSLSGEIVTVEETRFGFDIQYSLSPIIEDNMITGVSVFADNVTERKTKDRELAEANKKIGELKLMALRSVMSPHFIFNVLNSIQYFIAKNDRLNAITYLSTFSKLIRSILTHSVDNKIKLSDEIEMLKNYVQLEIVRFENKFNFVLNINDEVDIDSIEIPSLLIQPYVENAILHGLYNKTGTGTLKIDIYEENESVIFQIEDDGIGREAAQKLRDQNFPTHKSIGIKLTEERLQLINQKHNVIFEIEDLKNNDEPCGTRVRIGVIY